MPRYPVDYNGVASGPLNGSELSSERAYRELRHWIVSGQVPPGTRLVEADIARQLGVSRTPAREALKHLTTEGFVSRDAFGGLVVHEATRQEVEEIYYVREVLDGLAARLAAHRASPDDLARVDAVFEAMRLSIESGDTSQVVQWDIVFHNLIYEIAASPRLISIARDLRDFIRRFSTEAFEGGARATTVLAEHRKIVAALKAHDADAAERAARKHLEKARAHISQLRVSQQANV